MAKFEDGEPWKKVLGPLFVYANSMPNDSDWHQLWDDAKQQVFSAANIFKQMSILCYRKQKNKICQFFAVNCSSE